MNPAADPMRMLSDGELTVTRRPGIGGPNARYCLSLDGPPGAHALACDTDGVDGAAEMAGAVICPGILSGIPAGRAEQALDDNDAHGFLAPLNLQVVTDPVLTKVNNFRAILISRRQSGTDFPLDCDLLGGMSAG
ncbi:MOFRL family protein [Paracoccus everestensis]|uniref:MOFRL family protein n=1 Tax=Paracoccus everestensis TaxID=2903900 RepID=UPI001F2CEA52|nr:MOFRL family protein [Paracoccus everestensis]